jgi:hypothetical protein
VNEVDDLAEQPEQVTALVDVGGDVPLRSFGQLILALGGIPVPDEISR